MTLVLIIKDLVCLGSNPQNKGQMAARFMHIDLHCYISAGGFCPPNQQQLRRLKKTLLEGCVIPNYLCLISRDFLVEERHWFS